MVNEAAFLNGYDEMLCKLEMKERALEVISKEVFENIGQTLCLAKMQIGSLRNAAGNNQESIINEAGKLVYKAIHNLRKMTRHADADEVINQGFLTGLEKEIAFFNNLHDHFITLKIKGKNPVIMPGKELRLFCMLQEFFSDNFLTSKTIFANITVTFRKKDIVIAIKQEDTKEKFFMLSEGVREKSALLNAVMQTGYSGRHKKINWTINLYDGKDCIGR
jgi:glucose-6-phosphate-specific signal transduction histidine kinase